MTFRASSERRYAAAEPTSSAPMWRWSGARSSTIASIVGKPAIERAARVRTGPAEIAFTQPLHAVPSHYFNVTPFGAELIRRYRAIEAESARATAAHLRALETALSKTP